VVAAETGHLGLAYDYAGEAALMDLRDLNHNTRDGLHMASLAGAWIALVAGFGGFRDHDGRLTFDPRLPEGIDRLAFRLTFRERRLLVEVDHEQAAYVLEEGDELEIRHAGEPLVVTPGAAVVRPVRVWPSRPRPPQPPGRAPMERVPARVRGS